MKYLNEEAKKLYNTFLNNKNKAAPFPNVLNTSKPLQG